MSSFAYDVFISYSHRDSDWVWNWLLPRLEKADLKVCIDDRDFEIGVPSIINMENAVKRSRKTILVMTPNWTESEWTEFESILTQTGDPVGRKRRLVPIMLKACDLPDRLAIFTYADFTDSAQWETQLARVINTIRESSSLQPPTHLSPNLVHPYALQANFTGRVNERKELTAWLADEAHPIYALVAMGGMGKSALAWYWVKNDVLTAAQATSASALDGVMWWSFYEGESSFAKFIDDALKYVNGQPIDATQFPTTYDRAQELRKQLQTKRVLFVLDGFERQLRSYARLDAAYKPDDTTEPSREERACVDPITSRWLSDIAAGTTRAKVLLTTRLMAHDLEDRAGDALAGVLKRELKELPRDDAVKFMREQGVTKGTPAEIATVCDAYGYHPLSLRLLSGLIARDARMPGDIAAAPRHDVHDDLIQRQHHVLEQSYDALPKRERALLSRIAAFRSPMTYDALAIFNKLGEDAKLQASLEDLRVRGLLQRDTLNNRFDVHPLVRHYAYDRLSNKKTVHTRLRDYFAKILEPGLAEAQSIEDLAPIVELYHHTVRAGQYDEAFGLFRDRLHDSLYYRFGANQTQIELLGTLFPEGEDLPPRLKNEEDQAWALTALANAYSQSGQPRRAVPLFNSCIPISEKLDDKLNQAIELGNIAGMAQIILGELAAAEINLRRSIELCRDVKNKLQEGCSHGELVRLLAYLGAFDASAQESDIALDYVKNAVQPFGRISAYRALCALLMGDAQTALEVAQQAHRNTASWQNESDRILVEWLLGAVQVSDGKNLGTAATHLAEALTRCRRINLVDLEPDILLAWARWHRAHSNAREAEAYAEEALSIADRCEYRLKQADIHNFLARLALDAREHEVARKHAKIAKERAWCDGLPHCYKPALDEAERMLKELGAND